MGVDNGSILCLGVELGCGEEMQETFEDFLKKREKFPQEDDEDYEYEFHEIFDLVKKELDKEGTSLSSSPFCLNYACPYFDCEYEHVVLYVTHEDFEDTWGGISIEKALKLLQEFDKEALYAFLCEIGVEEEIEPRLFSLPHIH